MSCLNCRFYFDQGQGDGGLCRRYAPQTIPAVQSGTWERFPAWPWVKPTDWCGEFRSVDYLYGKPIRNVVPEAK